MIPGGWVRNVGGPRWKVQAMISAKLLHKALNGLQIIMGWIDVAEDSPDPEKRRSAFRRARDAVRELSRVLAERVEKKEKRSKT